MHRLAILGAVVGACAVGAACGSDSPRDRLRGALAREYGPETKVRVAYLSDTTHLIVNLQGPAFDTLADGAVWDRAREVAQVAFRYYERREALDSIEVKFVEFIGNNSYQNARRGRFAVAELRP